MAYLVLLQYTKYMEEKVIIFLKALIRIPDGPSDMGFIWNINDPFNFETSESIWKECWEAPKQMIWVAWSTISSLSLCINPCILVDKCAPSFNVKVISAIFINAV